MPKFKLNKNEKHTIRHMLYVYELSMRKRPGWASETLCKMWDEDIEEAKSLVEKLTNL